MNPKKFRQYSLRKKLSLVKKLGTQLAVRHYDHYQIYLYDLDKMIVEVWYTNRLLRKRAIKIEVSLASSHLLDPYPKMIQLDIDD